MYHVLLAMFELDPGSIDPYIDVDYVMLSSENSHHTILVCCMVLEMRTLLIHREACLSMLERDDIDLGPKKTLVKEIANQGLGPIWFAGEEELLEYLESLSDER